jgi:hypothetical protein
MSMSIQFLSDPAPNLFMVNIHFFFCFLGGWGGGVGGGGGKVSELVYMCVAYSHRKNKGIGCSLHDEKVVWCTYDWMAWYSSLVISIFLN